MKKQIDMFDQLQHDQVKDWLEKLPKRGLYHELSIHHKINLKAISPVFATMWMREGAKGLKGFKHCSTIDHRDMKELSGLGKKWSWQVKNNHYKSYRTLRYLSGLKRSPAKQLDIL